MSSQNTFYWTYSGQEHEFSDIPYLLTLELLEEDYNEYLFILQKAYENNIDINHLETRIEKIRKKIFNHRKNRIHPQKDDKILTDWNGLMIASMARAANILDNDLYAESAIKSMQFLLEKLRV